MLRAAAISLNDFQNESSRATLVLLPGKRTLCFAINDCLLRDDCIGGYRVPVAASCIRARVLGPAASRGQRGKRGCLPCQSHVFTPSSVATTPPLMRVWTKVPEPKRKQIKFAVEQLFSVRSDVSDRRAL